MGKPRQGKIKHRTKADQFARLLKAVSDLRKAASKRHGVPNTRMAVIAIDGIHMHKLLLGEEQAIGAYWKDVIHPEVVKQISNNPHLQEAGWLDLLNAKRLMGPSLHTPSSAALWPTSVTVLYPG
ncbi:MAG: hypothetical protein R3F37_17925 [Candidatus Competibacteraceae bacterium]